MSATHSQWFRKKKKKRNVNVHSGDSEEQRGILYYSFNFSLSLQFVQNKKLQKQRGVDSGVSGCIPNPGPTRPAACLNFLTGRRSNRSTCTVL